jgi:hypothetical protein
MKTIDSIIIHCSATRANMDVRASDIDKWHKERGFVMIGYNYVIDLDGTVEVGRPLTMNGAHCIGYNDHSIGICYIGGLDIFGNPCDTRTIEQKKAMHELVEKLMDRHPAIVKVLGHRDTSPDLNGDGKISPNEWVKSCPCFDVQAEFPMSYCYANK